MHVRWTRVANTVRSNETCYTCLPIRPQMKVVGSFSVVVHGGFLSGILLCNIGNASDQEPRLRSPFPAAHPKILNSLREAPTEISEKSSEAHPEEQIVSAACKLKDLLEEKLQRVLVWAWPDAGQDP